MDGRMPEDIQSNEARAADGNGQPTSDMQFAKQTTSVITVFEREEGDAIAVPHLTSEAQAVLDAELPPLEPDAAVIRRSAAEDDAARYGQSQIAAEPVRSLKRFLASAITSAMERKRREFERLRRKWLERQDRETPLQRIRVGEIKLLRWENLPKAVVLIFWFVFFALLLYAEFYNASVLVRHSYLNFEGHSIWPLTFSVVFVVGPLALFEFVYWRTDEEVQRQLTGIVGKVCLPAAFFGLAIFSR